MGCGRGSRRSPRGSPRSPPGRRPTSARARRSRSVRSRGSRAATPGSARARSSRGRRRAASTAPLRSPPHGPLAPGILSGFLTLIPETTEWTDEARDAFLRSHVDEIYHELTDGMTRPRRDQELLEAAAERYPGLVPSAAEMAAEGERKLADKEGAEIAQGLFVSRVLASPRAGAHLVWAMLRPTAEALE